jgi:hypothetical protein
VKSSIRTLSLVLLTALVPTLAVTVTAEVAKDDPKTEDSRQKTEAETAEDKGETPGGAVESTGRDESAAEADDAAAAAPAQTDDDDMSVDLAQPDFTIVTLPTTLRLPRFKSAFRVSHRFSRPLGDGDFGDLLDDFFGLDSSAGVGLEYRFGIARGTQIGIFRHSGKTIQFFLQRNIMSQGDQHAVGLDAVATVEGLDNFRNEYSPALGIVVSRTVGPRSALYVEPIAVWNTDLREPEELFDDDDYTLMLGLGARVGITDTFYVVGQVTPRISGFAPATTHISFGVEKRVGGHGFQLNFSNSFSQTMAEVARGGFDDDFWFLGFNITRKFY